MTKPQSTTDVLQRNTTRGISTLPTTLEECKYVMGGTFWMPHCAPKELTKSRTVAGAAGTGIKDLPKVVLLGVGCYSKSAFLASL